jgi:hypothetical protein
VNYQCVNYQGNIRNIGLVVAFDKVPVMFVCHNATQVGSTSHLSPVSQPAASPGWRATTGCTHRPTFGVVASMALTGGMQAARLTSKTCLMTSRWVGQTIPVGQT